MKRGILLFGKPPLCQAALAIEQGRSFTTTSALQVQKQYPWQEPPGPHIPSFSTSLAGVKGLPSNMSYQDMGLVVLTGRHYSAFSSDLGIDIDSFMLGSRKAIAKISSGISRYSYSDLQSFISRDCMEGLRREVMEVFTPSEVRLLGIKEEDIFFQCIHQAGVEDGKTVIDLVSFSLNGLDQCKKNTYKMEAWQQKMSELAQRSGFLKREDFKEGDYRKIEQEFQELNSSVLLWNREVVVSCFRFERSQGENWHISQVGYLNTLKKWNWVRRMKWKGRAIFALRYKIDFMKVLRVDLIIDLAALFLFVVLQVMAFIIGRNIESAERERISKQKRERDFSV